MFEQTLITRRNLLKFGALSCGALATSTNITNAETEKSKIKEPLLEYIPKDFSHLKDKLVGISNSQLEQHITLYKKYVSKINLIESKIKSFKFEPFDDAAYRALHVAQTFMLNGAILHELYFGNLGSGKKSPEGDLKKIINRDFESTKNFLTHLKSVGKVMRGWSIAAFNLRTNTLKIYGMDQHNDLTPSNVIPILALDVYEHAYMIDYGIDRDKYLDAFMTNLNWGPVEQRLDKALSIK